MMRRLLTFVSFLCLGLPKAQAVNKTIANAKLDVDALDDTIPFWTELLFPLISDAVNGIVSSLTLSVVDGSLCTCAGCSLFECITCLSCFGVRLDITISDFQLDPVDEGAVGIAVGQTDPLGRAARITVVGSNIGGAVNSISVAATLVAAGFAIPCDVTASVGLVLGYVGIQFGITTINEGRTFRIEFEDANILNLDIVFEPISACVPNELVSFVADGFVAAAEIAANTLLSWFGSAIFDFLFAIFPGISVDIPDIPPIEVFAGRNLVIEPLVSSFDASPDGQFLFGRVSSSFTGVLTGPDWRNGFSYEPDLIESNLADPELSYMANLNVGDVGLNTFIDTLWYLTWSLVATDSNALTSSLCEASPSDPCPFPPLGFPIRRLQRGYFSLQSGFLRFGVFQEFLARVVIPSPYVTFSDDRIAGTASVVIAMDGIQDGNVVYLASVAVGVTVSFVVPGYDVPSKKLTGLVIDSFRDNDPVFDFNGEGPRFRFGMNRLGAGVTRVLNEIMNDSVVPVFNDFVTTVFQDLELDIPVIPNIPVPGKGLKIDVIGADILGFTGATETDQSYVEVGTTLEFSAPDVPVSAFSQPTPMTMDNTAAAVDQVSTDRANAKEYACENPGTIVSFFHSDSSIEIQQFFTCSDVNGTLTVKEIFP